MEGLYQAKKRKILGCISLGICAFFVDESYLAVYCTGTLRDR